MSEPSKRNDVVLMGEGKKGFNRSVRIELTGSSSSSIEPPVQLVRCQSNLWIAQPTIKPNQNRN